MVAEQMCIFVFSVRPNAIRANPAIENLVLFRKSPAVALLIVL